MFTFISWYPAELSALVLPAVAMNGIGGIIYCFTTFQLGNLFESARSTVIAVMIGSYNASAVVYAILFMLYKVQAKLSFHSKVQLGLPFWGLMAIHGIIGIITFFEAWFNVPADPIPTLEEQRLTAAYEMSKKGSEAGISKKLPKQDSEISVETSVTVMETEEDIPSFLAVMFSWPCLLSLLTMCITQLRIVMYIGLRSTSFIHNKIQ